MRSLILFFFACASILFVAKAAAVVPPLQSLVHISLCDPTCASNGCFACCQQTGFPLGGLCVNVSSTERWCYCN